MAKKYFLVKTTNIWTETKDQMTKNGVKYYTIKLYKKNPADKQHPFMDLTIANWHYMWVGEGLLLVQVDINENTTITRDQFAKNPDCVKEVEIKW